MGMKTHIKEKLPKSILLLLDHKKKLEFVICSGLVWYHILHKIVCKNSVDFE